MSLDILTVLTVPLFAIGVIADLATPGKPMAGDLGTDAQVEGIGRPHASDRRFQALLD